MFGLIGGQDGQQLGHGPIHARGLHVEVPRPGGCGGQGGQGLAQALLAAVVADARERPSISVLTLTCTQGNERAQRLYASAGFEVFGVEPRAIFNGHDYKAKVHMHLCW